MNNQAHEKIIYQYVRSERGIFQHVDSRFFDLPEIQKCFEIDKEFYTKYSTIPSPHTLKEHIRLAGLNEKITDDMVDAIFNVNLTDYDEDWLETNVKGWLEFQNLKVSLYDSITLVKTSRITPENITQITSGVKDIILKRNNLDLSFDLGSDFLDPEAHLQATLNCYNSGYTFINDCLGGGFVGGTLIAVAGQSKRGKSIWLANLAKNVLMDGHNVAVLTLEMSEAKYLKRLGSNIFNIPMSKYDVESINTEKMVERMRKFSNTWTGIGSVPGSMYVKSFPTGTLTVPATEAYLTKLEEVRGIKLKMVVIDYINLMSNIRNPNTENTYMKIKQLAEDLRAMGQRHDWTILTATQYNALGFDTSEVTMNSIGESKGLIHTVDALFGIIQDPIMRMESKQYLKALALRDADGMDNKKEFMIDYEHMRIIETLEPVITPEF